MHNIDIKKLLAAKFWFCTVQRERIIISSSGGYLIQKFLIVLLLFLFSSQNYALMKQHNKAFFVRYVMAGWYEDLLFNFVSKKGLKPGYYHSLAIGHENWTCCLK